MKSDFLDFLGINEIPESGIYRGILTKVTSIKENKKNGTIRLRPPKGTPKWFVLNEKDVQEMLSIKRAADLSRSKLGVELDLSVGETYDGKPRVVVEGWTTYDGEINDEE